MALFTADPTDANSSANEVSKAAMPAYVRMNAAGNGPIATGWTMPANGVTSNTNVISFPANNGASAITVTHTAIYDAATGGNLLYHSKLLMPKTLEQGDVLSFSIGSIMITMA